MEINFGSRTDRGLAREENQDSCTCLSHGNTGIFVVADGMGGHSKGAEASKSVTNAISLWWYNLNKDVSMYSIDSVVKECKKCIYAVNEEIRHRMELEGLVGGSTVVVLIVWGRNFATISAGDSRVYRMISKKINQITIDDVWENLPENRAIIQKAVEERDERIGKLVMAVGVHEELTLKESIGVMAEEERFVICSDGVYKYCSSESMYKSMFTLFFKNDIDKALDSIVGSVIKNGAGDNYSVILVDYSAK